MNMKVYCLLGYYDYEGSQLFGVFDSFEKANEAKGKLVPNMAIGPDSWEIEEIELNSFSEAAKIYLD